LNNLFVNVSIETDVAPDFFASSKQFKTDVASRISLAITLVCPKTGIATWIIDLISLFESYPEEVFPAYPKYNGPFY